MFDDIEFNPAAAVVGVVAAGVVLIVMSNSTTGLIWKILGVIAGMGIGYAIGSKTLG
jgi:hypothetical protein